MKFIRIIMLPAIASCIGIINLDAAEKVKSLETIDCRMWPKEEKKIVAGNGSVVTYSENGQAAPENIDGIALRSDRKAFLRVDSKLFSGEFTEGLGITIKFKLFPRDKSRTTLRTLVSKYDYGTGDRCFSLMVDNYNRLEFSISADGIKGESVISKVNLEDDVEYTATALYFPGKTLELYVNGSEAGSAATAISKLFSGKSELRIGSRSDKGNPAQLLNGIIYKVDFFIPAAGSGKKLKPAAPIVHAAAAAADNTVKERIAIPFVDTDKNWEAAVSSAPALAGIFYKSEQELVTGKAAALQPSIKAAYFSDSIGFFVHCPVMNMKDFTDNRKDNFVEICIDPNNGDQTLFAVKIQSDGNVSNAFIASCDFVQKSWDSQAHAKVKLNADSCDVFVKIPYESFGMKLSPGDVFGLAVSVNLKQNGKNELSVWPNRKVFWTWWQRRLIPDPFFYADILLKPKNGSGIIFISTTRGALLTGGAVAENSFCGEIMNTSAEENSCTIIVFRLKDGQKHEVARHIVPVAGQSSMPVRFSYQAEGKLQFVVSDKSGNVLYDTVINKNLDIPPRIHDIGGSYVQEMVEKAVHPLAESGWIIYPQHMKGNEWAHSNARMLGYAYDLESTASAMGNNREIPHMTVRTETDYNNLTAKAGLLRKYGIKAAYYPHVKRIVMARSGGLPAEPYMVNVSKNPKSKESWDYKPLPSEAFKKDYFTALEQDFSKFGDIIFALILEDEFDYQFLKAMKAAFATPESQKRNPLILEINEDMKKRFGGGRYGLYNDSMPKADEPYCKIATHRWLNDWISSFIREAAQKARAASPGVKIIGDDPQGMVFPYDYRGRWHGVIDIAIHQTHDKGIPQDVGTAVVCKFVKDVSGVDEFWPCVHVEGSSSIFSLDETREELSRAFRNGATGLALFNLAWGGALGIREEIGAPERWAYIKQIAKFYGEGNRAKLPVKTDVGVFFSNYSTMADYSRGLGYVYMYLGPATGGYFKFFDDSSLDRGEVAASDYKTVFVHHAEYESPEAVKKLAEAVREKGITLVITDSQAFTKDCTGKTIALRDELLGGTEIVKSIGSQKIIPAPAMNSTFGAMKSMDVANAWSLRTGKDATVLFSYANGEPACISRNFGKGRVIFFGFNPFFHVNTMTLDPNAPTGFDYGDKAVADPNLAQVNQASRQFFTMLLKYLDIPLNCNIWKLKLPEPENLTGWPDNSCLTGNSIFWSLNRPRTIANVPASGKYRCSPAPEEKEGADKNGWTAIKGGRLFDRIRALHNYTKESDYILTWNNTAPVSIQVDLGYQTVIKSIDIYLSGAYPACEVLGSADGNKWQPAGRNDNSGKSEGVIKQSIKLDGSSARYIKIELKERKNQGKMIISEIDIWGDASRP